LWGEDLYERLYDVYANKSLFCVILFSHQYRQRAWTRHELRAAHARLLKDQSSYVLPVALDPGAVPDEFETLGFWAFTPGDEAGIADAVETKINEWVGRNYFSIDEVAENISRDLVAAAISDGFRKGIRSRQANGDRSGAEVLRLLNVIAICDSTKFIPAVRAVIDLILYASRAVASEFDGDGKVHVVDKAFVMRWGRSDGPLLLSARGWESFLDQRRPSGGFSPDRSGDDDPTPPPP
jgi:hypothetical protein